MPKNIESGHTPNPSDTVFGARTAAATGRVSVEQALPIAAHHIEKGQLPQAESILQQILAAQPGHAHALHLLGLVAFRAGQADKALELIEKAIAIFPAEAHFHRNIGEMYRLLKRHDQAIAHGDKAVALAPNDATAHSNLGIAFYDLKQYEQAEACQQRALEIDPSQAQALNNLGSIRRDRKDRDAALELYRKALEKAPEYLEARNNLAAVLTEKDRPEEALVELQAVVRHRPGYADAHCNVGTALLHLEQYERARQAFDQALRLDPHLRGALCGLSRVFMETDQCEVALQHARRALDIDPENPEVHVLLADIHVHEERYEEAEATYRKASELDPDSARSCLGMGQMWLELGKIQEAERVLQRAIELEPTELSPYVSLVQARKMKRDDDPLLARLEESLAEIDTMPTKRATALHFALGKAYDDLKHPDKAFPHFAEGCRLKRSQIQYDADNQDKICSNIREFFTRETIDSLRGGGDPSEMPIFVLGMPRSGTTLTETIIASHPDVEGGGEMKHLLGIAAKPQPGRPDLGFPLNMEGLKQEDLVRMGAEYVRSVRARHPDAKRVTDKMPANFQALGLIPLMLPNARIIHIRRNPADICLSNLTKLFSRSQYQSYDQVEMGRYYVAYARLMEHWREVLPDGAFLEVQYEELVADREAQTRRIIDFCGLEWNDACLEHHKTERSVKTASITQVRQPVYKTSVERWRKYEAHLQPLLEALGEYAPTA
jgi:tetratricopeptide (TPR) repeat protein